MSSIGDSLLCYGGNCCVQLWDLLCWVVKLSAAWEKGEGSRCIHWKIHHSRWTMVLQLEWSVLQWTISGRYFTAVDSGIVAWMECVTVNIIWKILHSSGQWYCSLNGVCYSEHYVEDTSQQWTVVLQLEWSVLQWTLSGRYFTAVDSVTAVWIQLPNVTKAFR